MMFEVLCFALLFLIIHFLDEPERLGQKCKRFYMGYKSGNRGEAERFRADRRNKHKAHMKEGKDARR